ncbi:MAG TPA: bacillithiol biosynthesis cysteine-adding enzyme BshC [Pyrinomonadaceae bacterium]|nr:bacillithiol biosynthesis cysteine-adding enzyme BshC [Pyrinomonadaceae bacterium]
MKQEIVCPCPSGTVVLETESLPFSEIPHQTKLFIEYQQNPLSLKEFYPNAVESHTQISARIPEVLENQKADRNLLCDALDEMNRNFGAGEKTLENIRLLRENDTVAVVTGQQAGLFSGAIYTIYKALSAVKMAECLRGRGHKAVPVFWIATEDHDFEEVSETFVINKNGELAKLKNEPKRKENLPVGNIKLDNTIDETVSKLFDELSQTEFSDELRELLVNTWNENNYYGEAFAKFITKLFEKYGLIILDPLDVRLKKLSAPIIKEAIEKSDEIVDALQKRSADLEKKGFHAQVLVGEDYFPLFLIETDGTRNALKKTKVGNFKTKSHEYSLSELAEIAANEPERFSASVVLRPIVQDYILPTVCYFGGGAEVSYFAQNAEVYRILNRPQMTVFHRQSFTIIESKHRKTLEKYEIEFKDLFAGEEEILPVIVEKYLNSETAKIFAEAEEKINIELNRLDQNLSQIEPTLAENLATRRRKILYHIGALRTKFHHAQIRQDETLKRRFDSMFTAVLPQKHLQERSVNINYFLNRYGIYFIDWLYQAINLDDKGHRIIYL